MFGYDFMYYRISYFLTEPYEDSPFVKVDSIGIDSKDLEVLQSKIHPVDKNLLPAFKRCIYQLDLLDADIIILYSTTDGFLSFSALYDGPIKHQTTFRLIRSKISMRRVINAQCD